MVASEWPPANGVFAQVWRGLADAVIPGYGADAAIRQQDGHLLLSYIHRCDHGGFQAGDNRGLGQHLRPLCGGFGVTLWRGQLALRAAVTMTIVVSQQAVDKLHEMGIEVVMLTGDSQAVAQAVGEELGIDQIFAEVLPEDKDKMVMKLQKEGKQVAMVGDGVNDAPALTRADVGIAIGSGTDVAVESAGLILVKSNPLDVVKIFALSKASYRKMIQNLIWATGYNIIALPLAAGVLAPFGILLSPAVGALFMSLSTVIVAINAQLLRRQALDAV